MPIVKLKTHLIVSGMHEEYFVHWTGKLIDAKPVIKNNLPIFIIIGTHDRVEINTMDITRIEECAKRLAVPHGRQAVTTATSYIYIKEVDGNQKLLGHVTHNHVKEYQQMYDSFEQV